MFKDKVYIGLLVGLIVPFVGYALLLVIFEALGDLTVEAAKRSKGSMMLSKKLLQLLSIFLLILPMNYFNKQRFLQAMRGMVFPLMGYCIWWIYTYQATLF